jgi:hypothetical protein
MERCDFTVVAARSEGEHTERYHDNFCTGGEQL